jgi:hypothetical protein
MSAKKRYSDDGGVAVMSRRGRSKSGRGWMIALAIVVAGVTAGCYFVWQHVREHVLAGSEYHVHPENVSVTSPPEWIKGDVKADVLRDATRSGPLSLLDDDLAVRLAGAFSAHPWVARVDRVSKHFPSGVEVSLAYRVPVAMVEVQGGDAVLPVDVQGVVLPTRDSTGEANFTTEEAERYPRIAEIHTLPSGPEGTRWGDAGVLGGAQIAAALASDWTALDLARIIPWERKPAASGVEYTFALVTHSGTTVHWGRAPGTEAGGEVPAAQKIAQLKRYAAGNGGTLDGPDGPQEILIDNRGALLQKPRPVVTPLPKREVQREPRP